MLAYLRRLAAIVIVGLAAFTQIQPLDAMFGPGDYPYSCYIEIPNYCEYGTILSNAGFDGCMENPDVWSECYSADLFCEEWCNRQPWAGNGGVAQSCQRDNGGYGPDAYGECYCIDQPWWCCEVDGLC
jgi:hypothetical protein